MIFCDFSEYILISGDNEFNRFIRNDDPYGRHQFSATTSSNATIFSFRTKLKCWEEALQHFARLFDCPQSMSEVTNAVHRVMGSEFTILSDLDSLGRDKLLSRLGSPGHPSSNFPKSGLRARLENMDIVLLHQRLEQFWNRHYSARRMFLCMQSSLSLDALQEIVVKNFSNTHKHRLSPLDYATATYENAFQTKFHEQVIFRKPVWYGMGWLTSPTLTLTWCLPPERLVSKLFFSFWILKRNRMKHFPVPDLQSKTVYLFVFYSRR